MYYYYSPSEIIIENRPKKNNCVTSHSRNQNGAISRKEVDLAISHKSHDDFKGVRFGSHTFLGSSIFIWDAYTNVLYYVPMI